jgi:hypothetical protein
MLIPKPCKNEPEETLTQFRLISLKNIATKILKKYLRTEANNPINRKIMHHNQVGFIPRTQGGTT